MTLIDNAGQLWHRFWSVRFGFASALCGGAAAVMPFLAPAQPGRVFVGVMFVVTVAAPLLAMAAAASRVVAQPKLQKDSDG